MDTIFALLDFLGEVLTWLSGLFASIFSAIVNFFKGAFQYLFDFITDIPVIVLDGILGAVLMLFNSLPIPTFLETHSMGELFTTLPSPLLYLVSKSGLAQGLAIFGAGVSFRLLRKLFTLGQW